MFRSVYVSLMAACLCVSGFSPQSARAAEGPQRWAVLIGVNDYNNAKDLTYCVADQQALRDRLIAAGFSEKRIFLLRDGASESRFLPFKVNIEQQLKLLLGLVEEKDLVIVSFSGHGVQFRTKAYFCPTDATLDDADTLVSLDWVYDQLKWCPASMKLVVVDACRNDPSLGGAKTFSNEARDFGKSLGTQPPEGIVLLSSCSPGEISREDEKLRHGVFTHFLLDGLSGKADGNQDGEISLNELFRHVGRETKLHVAHKFNDSQRPYLRGETTLEVLDFPLAEVLKRKPSLAVAPFDETTAKRFQHQWAEYLGQTVETTNSIGMKLRLIPAGEFLIGSAKSPYELVRMFDLDEDGKKYFTDEHPRHRVQITQPFYLGETEVTQAQWNAVMNTEPWSEKKHVMEGDDYAATDVSWEEAQEFCKRLSAKERKTYRLPTEAEWEYACRAGTTTAYHFGDDATLLGEYAWFRESISTDELCAHQVGLKEPNPFGLYDIYGNVYEWCYDWKADYVSDSVTDPTGPSSGSDRVLRGGGWFYDAWFCRSADRTWRPPFVGLSDQGFRVACSSVR